MYTKHKATFSNLKQILFFGKKHIYSLIHHIYQISIRSFCCLVLWFWDGFRALFDQNQLEVELLSPHRLDWDRIITVAIRGISGTHRNHLAGTGDHLEMCVFWGGGRWQGNQPNIYGKNVPVKVRSFSGMVCIYHLRYYLS